MQFTTIIVPLLASLALAQPHKRQHQHAAKHHEARNAEPVIKWVTEYEYTTEVVPVTKTIVCILRISPNLANDDRSGFHQASFHLQKARQLP